MKQSTDPPPPLAQYQEEVFDIFDEDPPLVYYDPEMMEEIIFDEDIPLSMMPQTGVGEMVNTLASGLMLAALLISVVATTIKKMNKKEAEEAAE